VGGGHGAKRSTAQALTQRAKSVAISSLICLQLVTPICSLSATQPGASHRAGATKGGVGTVSPITFATEYAPCRTHHPPQTWLAPGHDFQSGFSGCFMLTLAGWSA
jgi:hypothetical protein